MADIVNKKIENIDHENWDGNSADEEEKVRKESAVSKGEEEQPKVVVVKENLKKDKKGNIIIESLRNYDEPEKMVKETRNQDMVGQHDRFAGIDVSSDEDEGNNGNVGFSGLEVEKEVVSKKGKKGGKGQKQKNVKI